MTFEHFALICSHSVQDMRSFQMRILPNSLFILLKTKAKALLLSAESTLPRRLSLRLTITRPSIRRYSGATPAAWYRRALVLFFENSLTKTGMAACVGHLSRSLRFANRLGYGLAGGTSAAARGRPLPFPNLNVAQQSDISGFCHRLTFPSQPNATQPRRWVASDAQFPSTMTAPLSVSLFGNLG